MRSRKPSAFERAWDAIHEPKSVTLLMMAAYIVSILAGYVACATRISQVTVGLGGSASITWGALLIAGGTVGVIAAPLGFWAVEKAGIMILSLGLAIYALAQVFLPGYPPLTLVRLAFTVMAGILFAVRYERIRLSILNPGDPLITTSQFRPGEGTKSDQ